MKNYHVFFTCLDKKIQTSSRGWNLVACKQGCKLHIRNSKQRVSNFPFSHFSLLRLSIIRGPREAFIFAESLTIPKACLCDNFYGIFQLLIAGQVSLGQFNMQSNLHGNHCDYIVPFGFRNSKSCNWVHYLQQLNIKVIPCWIYLCHSGPSDSSLKKMTYARKIILKGLFDWNQGSIDWQH